MAATTAMTLRGKSRTNADPQQTCKNQDSFSHNSPAL
jgi:hypothetical protein